MAGIKRKTEAVESNVPKKRSSPVKRLRSSPKRGPLPQSSSEENFGEDLVTSAVKPADSVVGSRTSSKHNGNTQSRAKDKDNSVNSGQGSLNGTSSRESHAKQKMLVQERKAAKPNANSIARSKKLWERLRLKSHVPKEEREKLVKELFEIVTGRVKDFVFKHDSVRIIQCALKYATPDQRRQIARELKGEYRELAQSKYAKFLIAKLVVGDNEIRDLVVPEFYGHVKRLIRHPEASWIMDDIYRTIASREQREKLLREWYGPEFVVFKSADKTDATADLSQILSSHPEKRSPIMQHLKELTNQLVQKKTTGFTMLHDALLQYFLNCKPGSPEATEFLEMLKDDEEGDCYKNLAFTKSGSRLVCLTLAYGTSKDRRTILKFFKTHIKLLASDPSGHLVLLAAYDMIDDTVMSAKAIFPELLSKDVVEKEAREQGLLSQVEHITARIPLLYLLSADPPKWLLPESDTKIIEEYKIIRTSTSKKDPETRRNELVKGMSQPLLDLISSCAGPLAQSSFGCQFITEVMLGAIGDKVQALQAVASLAESSDISTTLHSSHVSRMLKVLSQGGRYDKSTNTIMLVEPPLAFHDVLYEKITAQSKEMVIQWADSSHAFVIVAMLEASDFKHRAEMVDSLLQQRGRLLKTVGEGSGANTKSTTDTGNAGLKIILEMIGGRTDGHTKKAIGDKKRSI